MATMGFEALEAIDLDMAQEIHDAGNTPNIRQIYHPSGELFNETTLEYAPGPPPPAGRGAVRGSSARARHEQSYVHFCSLSAGLARASRVRMSRVGA